MFNLNDHHQTQIPTNTHTYTHTHRERERERERERDPTTFVKMVCYGNVTKLTFGKRKGRDEA